MGEVPPNVVCPEPRGLKQEIVQDLGESSLVLPELINRGLEANDRAKYLLALIQAARAQADHPDQPFSSLREERLVAGVADDQFDGLIGQWQATGGGCYFVPGIESVHSALVAAIAEMIVPLDVARGSRSVLDPVAGDS